MFQIIGYFNFHWFHFFCCYFLEDTATREAEAKQAQKQDVNSLSAKATIEAGEKEEEEENEEKKESEQVRFFYLEHTQ